MKLPLLLVFALLFFLPNVPLQAEYVQKPNPEQMQQSQPSPSSANKGFWGKARKTMPFHLLKGSSTAGGVVIVVLAAIFTLPVLSGLVAITFGASAIGVVALLFAFLLVTLLYWAGILLIQRKGQRVGQRKRLLDSSVIFGSISATALFSALIFMVAFDWVGLIVMGIIALTALIIWTKYALRPLLQIKE